MENKFATYNPIQLAGEESFIRWVHYGESDNLWRQWLSQHPAIEDKIEEARKIVLSLSNQVAEQISDKEKIELWNRINGNIAIEKPKLVTKKIRVYWKIGVAAAAALALLVWINIAQSSEKVIAQVGQQKTITLPEESIATLNAGSYIKYKDKTFGEERIVHLEGEAFFNVVPGSKFVVETKNGSVSVLGTSFNVYSRDGQFEVSCYTGKVRIENRNRDQLVITPGEKVIQDTGNKSLRQTSFIATGNQPGWTTGKFTFENQDLKEVVEELERQYGIKVRLESGLETIKYTGLFEKGDLDNALSLITWPLHLKSKVEGKTVTISR